MWSNAGWQSDDGGWYANKAAGGGSPSFAANAAPAQQNLGFGSGTATFSAATGTGLVVVTIQAETNGHNLSGVTLNGSAMTLAVAAAVTNNRIAEIWYLAGQTANGSSSIVATVAGGGVFNGVGIQTSTLTNVTATPTATATAINAAPASPYSVGPLSPAVPATGFGIASARWDSANTYTPGTGVTDDFTATSIFEGKLAHMGGGATTATWTGTNFDQFCAAFAAWGP